MTVASNTQTNEQLIADWVRLCSSHDLDGLMRIFTEDVVYEDMALGHVNRGQQDVRAFAGEFFSRIPDVTLELSSSFATPTQGGTE
jgi:ketosteroid isomerase-like protein